MKTHLRHVLLAMMVLASCVASASAQPARCTFTGRLYYKGDGSFDIAIPVRVTVLPGYISGVFGGYLMATAV